MGYTIAAHAINAKLQKKMMEFMEKNYRAPHVIFGVENDYSRLALGKDLSYDHCKLAIGFDYNACEPERDYIFAVVRWMALQIGKRRFVKGLGGVPVYYYDGSCRDTTPILVKKEWKSKISNEWKWCLTSPTGHRTCAHNYNGTPTYDGLNEEGKKKFLKKMSMCRKALCGYNFEETDRVLSRELNRLDRLWKREK